MEDTLRGTKQLERNVWIDAPLHRVWDVIDDAGNLPQWAPVVSSVERHAAREEVGAVRECRVEMDGKPGRMVERCVGRVEGRQLSYVVDDESFGMTRMFRHYGFRVSLAPENAGTRVSIETYYTPKNLVVGAMNRLMLRRRFTRVVDGLLDGLRAHVERP